MAKKNYKSNYNKHSKNLKSIENATENVKSTVSIGVKFVWIIFGILLVVLLVGAGIKLWDFVSENVGGLFK